MTWPAHVIARPLTESSLDGIGQVLGRHGPPRAINAGLSHKWDRLVPPAAFDRPMNLGLLQTVSSEPQVRVLERHQRTHQFFMPTRPGRYLVAVAGDHPEAPAPRDLQVFLVDGDQGVCFDPGTWHSPLVVLEGLMTFVTAMADTADPDLDLRPIEPCVPVHLKECS